MTMPRCVDDILNHADDRAACFDNYNPDPHPQIDPEAVAQLRLAVQERSDAVRHVLEAIRRARGRQATPATSSARTAPGPRPW